MPDNSSLAPSNALIVVAKRPAPGQTKTRLSPPFTPQQAAILYECCLRDTLDLIRQVQGVHPVLAYLPPGEGDYFSCLAPDFELHQQEGSDLGSRLDNALTHYLKKGYRSAVIMASDSPTLPAGYLAAAFRMLEEGVDAVIGPSDDGGYYLIGLKQAYPRLLREVRMSTPNVIADTMTIAAEEQLQVGLLPAWYDVDDHQSLKRLCAELRLTPDSIARFTREALMQPSYQMLLALLPEVSISSISTPESLKI